jgi:hypothetical protein
MTMIVTGTSTTSAASFGCSPAIEPKSHPVLACVISISPTKPRPTSSKSCWPTLHLRMSSANMNCMPTPMPTTSQRTRRRCVETA